MTNKKKKKFFITLPLHIYISCLFVTLIIIVCAIQIFLTQKSLLDITVEANNEMFEQLSNETRISFVAQYQPAFMQVSSMSYGELAKEEDFDKRSSYAISLLELLADSKDLTSYLVGYPNGDMFAASLIADDKMLYMLKAPKNAMFSVLNLSAQNQTMEQLYYDSDYNLLLRRLDLRPKGLLASYDVREKEWFQQAKMEEVTISDPYYFEVMDEIGLTIQRKTRSGSVVAAEILTRNLSETLRKTVKKDDALRVLYDDNEQVYASNKPDLFINKDELENKAGVWLEDINNSIVLTTLRENLKYPNEDKSPLEVFWLDGEQWYGEIVKIHIYQDVTLNLLMAIRTSELVNKALEAREHALIVSVIILVLSLPIIYFFSRVISKPILIATLRAKSIENFDFSYSTVVPSHIKEIQALRTSLVSMQQTIKRFFFLTNAIAKEENLEQLIELVCKATAQATNAKAGYMYLIDFHDNILTPQYAWWGSSGRVHNEQLPKIKLDDISSIPFLKKVFIDKEHAVVTLDELKTLDVTDAVMTSEQWFLFVPLFDRKKDVIGILGLVFQHTEKEWVLNTQLNFIDALTSFASVSIEAKRMFVDQKSLLNSFVKLIAEITDTKSRYTGNHCQRVPVLVQKLALAAHNSQERIFADYHLDAEDFEALHIAAWLHDCGKIITPEHIIEKSSKLETIYNRIHEIRTRFEVLKRDAKIEMYQRALNSELPEPLRLELEQKWQQLDEEFAFIAKVNEGGEFLSQEAIARINQIGDRTWMRTLNNRLGLSQINKERYKHSGENKALPTEELLLQDKPYHLVEWDEEELKDTDPRFTMKRMPYKANLGERYNLSITRGTLTAEDRFIINDHIIQTIKMLEQLPFSKPMKNIPMIAGCHHEKIDGTGYPMGLKGEDMSLSAKIMAIADIFEALTSNDRPYRPIKTLSEALNIMSFMVKDKHIDSDVFRLFLTSGVYLEYAKQFMLPSQLDVTDIEAFLNKNA